MVRAVTHIGRLITATHAPIFKATHYFPISDDDDGTGHCIDVITISIDYDMKLSGILLCVLSFGLYASCVHSPTIEIVNYNSSLRQRHSYWHAKHYTTKGAHIEGKLYR